MEDSAQARLTAGAVNRLNILAVILFLGGACISGLLVALQALEHAYYLKIAKSQQEEKISLHAPRGSIFDRNAGARTERAWLIPAYRPTADRGHQRAATEMLGTYCISIRTYCEAD